MDYNEAALETTIKSEWKEKHWGQ